MDIAVCHCLQNCIGRKKLKRNVAIFGQEVLTAFVSDLVQESSERDALWLY